MATAPAPAIQLRGLCDAWELGDGVTRPELLAALFDYLHLSGGTIVGYTARADRHGDFEADGGAAAPGHECGR
jgi:hypothetical protein